MNNNERSEAILLDVVEEYIRMAEPVSSRQLLKNHEYGLSSATIRNLMAKLDAAGFLYQPHTSAGRIPTQKAYRFFVDKVELGLREDPRKKQGQEKDSISLKFKKELRDATRKSPDTVAHMLSHHIAQLTNTMAFAGLVSLNHFYKEGLGYLLNEPEFMDMENVRSLIEYTDFLETRLDKLCQTVQNDTHVYIGEFEQQTAPFSLLVFTSNFAQQERGAFGIIGPMRMRYGQNLELLNSVRELFDNND